MMIFTVNLKLLGATSILFTSASAIGLLTSPYQCVVSDPKFTGPLAHVSDKWCQLNCIGLDGTPNGHPACIYDIMSTGSNLHTRCICSDQETPVTPEPEPEPEPQPEPELPTCQRASGRFVISGVQENPAGSPASHNLLEGEWFRCTSDNCDTSTLGSAFLDREGYYRLTSKAGTRYVYANENGVQMAINELDSVMSVYMPNVNIGRQGGRFGFVWGVGTGNVATAFDGSNRGCDTCTVTMCNDENLFENLGFIISGVSNSPENPPESHSLLEGEFTKCTPATCTDTTSLAHAHVDADGYYRITSKAGTRYVYSNNNGVQIAINELDSVMSVYMPGVSIGSQGGRFGFVWGPGTGTIATSFDNGKGNTNCPTCLTTITGAEENPFENLVVQPGFTIDGLLDNPEGPPASQGVIEGDYHLCTVNNCDTSRLGSAFVDDDGFYRFTSKAGTRYVYENQHNVQIAINELDSVMSIYLPGANPGKQGGRTGFIYGVGTGKMVTAFDGSNRGCSTCTVTARGGLNLFANL